jgi:hypothetical protein
LRTAGFCVNGAKDWFESNGWDFKDFIKNGRASEDGMNLNDAMANAVLEAAYKRVNNIK